MRKSAVQIVARNIARAIGHSRTVDSQRALARAAGVAPNTVKNIVEPESRAPGPRGEVSPRLDVIEKIAGALGYELWQLLLEDFDPADKPTRALTKREAEWHAKIERLYREMPPDPLKDLDVP